MRPFAPDEVRRIWTLYLAKLPSPEIAKQLGRSESGVRRVIQQIIQQYSGDVERYLREKYKVGIKDKSKEERKEETRGAKKRGRKTEEEKAIEEAEKVLEDVEGEELKEALRSAVETAKSKKGKAATVVRAMTEKKITEEATENVAFALHYGTFINKYVKPLAHANNMTVTDYLAETIAFYELYKDAVETLKLKAELYKELLTLALEALLPENQARRKALMIKDLIMSLAAKGYQIPRDVLNEYLKVVKGG